MLKKKIPKKITSILPDDFLKRVVLLKWGLSLTDLSKFCLSVSHPAFKNWRASKRKNPQSLHFAMVFSLDLSANQEAPTFLWQLQSTSRDSAHSPLLKLPAKKIYLNKNTVCLNAIKSVTGSPFIIVYLPENLFACF